MPSHETPEELRLAIERGGVLICTPATDSKQRAAQCSMAWGLSMMFGGDTVHVLNYLPGVHLDIQALRLPEPLPPGRVPYPMRRTVLDWERLDCTLWNSLHGRWASETIVVTDEEARCLIHHSWDVHEHDETVAFTLQCLWPGVPGRKHATR